MYLSTCLSEMRVCDGGVCVANEGREVGGGADGGWAAACGSRMRQPRAACRVCHASRVRGQTPTDGTPSRARNAHCGCSPRVPRAYTPPAFILATRSPPKRELGREQLGKELPRIYGQKERRGGRPPGGTVLYSCDCRQQEKKEKKKWKGGARHHGRVGDVRLPRHPSFSPSCTATPPPPPPLLTRPHVARAGRAGRQQGVGASPLRPAPSRRWCTTPPPLLFPFAPRIGARGALGSETWDPAVRAAARRVPRGPPRPDTVQPVPTGVQYVHTVHTVLSCETVPNPG